MEVSTQQEKGKKQQDENNQIVSNDNYTAVNDMSTSTVSVIIDSHCHLRMERMVHNEGNKSICCSSDSGDDSDNNNHYIRDHINGKEEKKSFKNKGWQNL